jgi:hypothetical protein
MGVVLFPVQFKAQVRSTFYALSCNINSLPLKTKIAVKFCVANSFPISCKFSLPHRNLNWLSISNKLQH